MGEVYIEQGEFNKAIKELGSSLEIAEEIGDKYGVLQNYSNLGNAYYLKEDFKEALEYYRKALSIAIKMKVVIIILPLYSKITSTLIKTSSFTNAKINNEEAIKTAEDNKNDYWIIQYRILEIKISFKTLKTDDQKIKNCVKPLEKLLEKLQNEEQVALINYELTIMNNELSRNNDAENYRKTATGLLIKLYNKIPKIEYKIRLENLKDIGSTVNLN